ncbi:MAG: PAS domain S-box protein [Actinomycetota bacterium]
MKQTTQRYGLAVAATTLAFVLTVSLRSLLEPASYSLYFAAVIVSAWYGGAKAGAVSILLAVAGSLYLALSSPFLHHHLPASIVFRLVLFALVSALAVSLTERFHAASRREAELARSRVAALEQEQSARQDAEAAKGQVEAILDSLTDVFLSVDREWRVTHINRAAERYLQAPQQELIGRNVWEQFPEAVSLAFHREAHRAVRERTPVEFVEFYPPIDCWFEVRCFPTAQGLTAFIRDVTEQRRAVEALEVRTRQQAVVAELGRMALAGIRLTELVTHAVQKVASTLGIGFVKVLERRPDGKALLLRAGIGWKEGLVGRATVSAGADSHAGYTLLALQPVVMEDLRTETRFSAPLLADHGIVSGVNVLIGAGSSPFGVLGAYADRKRRFDQDDISFLQSVANVLSMAVEHEAAEGDLRKLSSVVEQTADAVLITDPDGRIEYVNPAFERLTGYSREEAAGQTPRILRSGRQEARTYEELWRTILSGRVFHGILVNRTKDGRLFYSQKTITPLRDESGAVVRFVSTDKDVTENRRAEEALRQREASLAEAQRIAQLGSWDWDLAGGDIQWSDETFRIFGLEPQEFKPRYERYLAQVHPDDREMIREAVEAALAGTREYRIDHRIIRPDGTERIVQGKAEVVRDESGHPLRMIGTAQDITERKQAALALQRSNRALRALSESNRALATTTNEETLLSEVCRIAVEAAGYRFAWIGFAEQDEGKAVRPVAHAGLEDGYLSALNLTWADTERGRGPAGTAIRSGQPYAVRDISTDPRFTPWREAALRRGYASVLALPLSANETVHGALMIYAGEPNAFDVEEVRLLREIAGNLAYGIHTLRTRQERARAGAELKAAREELLRAALEKKHFYSAVIGAVTRGKLRLVEPGEIPVDGEPAFQLTLETSGNYAELRALLSETALRAGMAPEHVAHLVLAAGEAVTNAIKHGAHGECAVRRTEDRIIVRVSDQGPGILPETLPSALLAPGFSTKVSLGMGFTLILELTDHIWLATGGNGTMVQLEKWLRPEEHPDQSLEALLERF